MSPACPSPLSDKHIAIGMGFERLTTILQRTDSNYDTNIITLLYVAIREITGVQPVSSRLGTKEKVGYINMV